MGMLLRRRNAPLGAMTTKESLGIEKPKAEKESTKDAKPPVVKRKRQAK